MGKNKQLQDIDRELEALLERRLRVLGADDPEGNARRVLFHTMGEIDRCEGIFARAGSQADAATNPVVRADTLPRQAVCACAGVEGAYAHIACEELFQSPQIRFYEEFEDVFQAVQAGEAHYGVVPVENSSAGAVDAVLELIGHCKLYINASVSIPVSHCLCIHPDTDPAQVTQVLSHPQALAQCKGFLRQAGYTPVRYSNTAAAALAVSESSEPLACICSWRGAKLHGLRILRQGIQDFAENYTRFVCISRLNLLLDGADTVSITVSCPNETGSLSRLLIRFALCDLSLSKIQSMPIASRDYQVVFQMDFKGNVLDSRVASLLGQMGEEFPNFRYLGNYPAWEAEVPAKE